MSQVAMVPQVVHKPRSFLSNLILGISAIVIVLTVCGTTVALFGLRIADRKTSDLLGAIEVVTGHLPQIRQALPAVLADAFDDVRRPEYREQLDLQVRLVPSGRSGGGVHHRPVLTLKNKGKATVTLMSVRVVALAENDEPVAEWQEWAATPFAGERPWYGPLLPGSERRLSTRQMIFREGIPLDNLRLEVDVNELRVWQPRPDTAPAPAGKGGAL